MVLLNPDAALRRLRQSRSDPPGRAATDPAQRSIYSAALQQFEELLAAATVSGAASRPLPLFYALSQAGRAVVASFGDVDAVKGHGLRQHEKKIPENLFEFAVRPVVGRDKADAFGAVARAICVQPVTGPVTVGEAWAGIPVSYNLPAQFWHPDWRPVLTVFSDLGGVPEDKTVIRVVSWSGNPHVAYEDVPQDLLNRYPTIPSRAVAVLNSDKPLGPGQWMADIGWHTRTATLDEVAPVLDHPDRALRPSLAQCASDKLLTPELLLWWTLLFGLSLLARYEPAEWVAALDVERSPAAVPIEAMLDKALERLPVLLAEALLARSS